MYLHYSQASFKKLYETQGNAGNTRKNSSSNVSTTQSNQHGSNNTCNGCLSVSPQLMNMNVTNCSSNNNVMMYFNYVDMNTKLNDVQCQQDLSLSPSITRENLNMFYIQKDSGGYNCNMHANSKNYIEKEKYLPNSNNVYPKYNLIDFYMGQGEYVNYFPHLHQFQLNNYIHNYYQQNSSNTQS